VRRFKGFVVSEATAPSHGSDAKAPYVEIQTRRLRGGSRRCRERLVLATSEVVPSAPAVVHRRRCGR